MTAKETYELFLDGIRSQYTTVIPPETFNRFINEQQKKWVNTIQDDVERTQRRQDQLSILHTDLDGLPYKPLYYIANTDKIKVFPIPEITPTNTTGTYNYDANKTMEYPNYFRLRNLYGLLADGTQIELASLDSNEEDEILSNTYSKPSKDKCYYITSDGGTLLTNGRIWKVRCDSVAIVYVGGSYLRMPRRFFFDESRPEDDLSNTGYKDGGGSIPLEFRDIQTQEIIDFAVREALERKSNPRFKSFSESQVLRHNLT